eukprot:scaffold2597_cov116-Cylindrotheca_fusiformis.AAC.1
MNRNIEEENSAKDQGEALPQGITELYPSAQNAEWQESELVQKLFDQIGGLSDDAEDPSDSDFDRSNASESSPSKRRRVVHMEQENQAFPSFSANFARSTVSAPFLSDGETRLEPSPGTFREKHTTTGSMDEPHNFIANRPRTNEGYRQNTKSDSQTGIPIVEPIFHRYNKNESYSTTGSQRRVGQLQVERDPGEQHGLPIRPRVHQLYPSHHRHHAHRSNSSDPSQAHVRTPPSFAPPRPFLPYPGHAQHPHPDPEEPIVLPAGMQIDIGGRSFRMGYASQYMSQEQARRYLESFRKNQGEQSNPQTPSSSPARR